MSLRKKTISGAKWSVVSMSSTVGAQFLQVAILAHLLKPSELGLASMVSLVTTLPEFFLSGLNSAIVQPKHVSAIELSSFYWLNALWGALFGGALLAGGGVAAWFFSEPELKRLLSLAALTFFVIPHYLPFQAMMARSLMFDRLSKIEVACSVALFATTLVAATHGYGAYSPVLGILASATCRAVLCNLLGRKLYTHSLRFKFSLTIPHLRFGVYQALDLIVNYLNSNFGGLVTGRLLGAATLGGYNLALNCAVNLPARLYAYFTQLLFPVFSQIQDERAKLRENYYKIMGFLAMLNFPLVFGLMVVAPDFVACVFGAKWRWITPIVQVLCLVGAFRCISSSVAAVLMATGRVKTSFRFNAAKTVAMLPAIIIGARLGGAIGVAAALLAVELAAFVPTYVFMLRPILGPSFKDYLGACFVPLRMTVPMVVVVLLASKFVHAAVGNPAALAAEVGLGALVFGATFLLDRSSLCSELRGIVLSLPFRRERGEEPGEKPGQKRAAS